MWYGIITLSTLFILLLIAVSRIGRTSDTTDRILRNELKRRSSIRNKHKLMLIEGITIKRKE